MGKKYKLIYVLLLTLLLDCFGCRKKSISDSNNPTATDTMFSYAAKKYTHLLAESRVWHHSVEYYNGFTARDSVTLLPDTTITITINNDSTIISPLPCNHLYGIPPTIFLVQANNNILYFHSGYYNNYQGWNSSLYYYPMTNKILMVQSESYSWGNTSDTLKFP